MVARIVALVMTLLMSQGVFLLSSAPTTAQDVPDRIACDIKWIKSGKPAEYKQFINSCLPQPQEAPEDRPLNGDEFYRMPAYMARLGISQALYNVAVQRFPGIGNPQQDRRRLDWLMDQAAVRLDRQQGNSYSIRIRQ
jgi:hypothetical protein